MGRERNLCARSFPMIILGQPTLSTDLTDGCILAAISADIQALSTP